MKALKIKPEFFEEIVKGNKKYEYRNESGLTGWTLFITPDYKKIIGKCFLSMDWQVGGVSKDVLYDIGLHKYWNKKEFDEYFNDDSFINIYKISNVEDLRNK